jgi:hypothetical protein
MCHRERDEAITKPKNESVMWMMSPVCYASVCSYPEMIVGPAAYTRQQKCETAKAELVTHNMVTDYHPDCVRVSEDFVRQVMCQKSSQKYLKFSDQAIWLSLSVG